jgi:hypothetical protein
MEGDLDDVIAALHGTRAPAEQLAELEAATGV